MVLFPDFFHEGFLSGFNEAILHSAHVLCLICCVICTVSTLNVALLGLGDKGIFKFRY